MSGRAVVFDFDGVLIRGDSTVDFLRRRLRRAPWLLPPITFTAAGFALSDRHGPSRTRWSERVVGALGLGRSMHAVESELRELAHTLHADASRVPERASDVLRDHVRRGDRVLVSSAGLEPFVRTWVSLLDEPNVTVAASTLVQRPWGVAMADHHYGARKLQKAAELDYMPPFDIVYSDSDADLPLLQNARQPVLVGPSERTLRALPAAVRARATVWRG
ncbi:HAD family hydrolase [Aeromicrobium sp. CTD01-1L150]|uniref:HAD family hydrolase n=1 Tax=Aeromicrobium sp. CTD01-1L150 TaxID=3341830 RepID=UPI0035C1673E